MITYRIAVIAHFFVKPEQIISLLAVICRYSGYLSGVNGEMNTTDRKKEQFQPYIVLATHSAIRAASLPISSNEMVSPPYSISPITRSRAAPFRVARGGRIVLS